MWPFKKNPYKHKYLQIKVIIPRGNTKKITTLVPFFTNKPNTKDTSLTTFDLDNKNDINKICRLNYGYKKNNFNTPYIPHEIITFCVESHNQRGLKNNGKS